jgi:4-amino-4-deoxy-L-arabinose transferase-like glycosyltransferase
LKTDDVQTGREIGQKLHAADVALAALLFAAGVALRVPFRSQFAYHWDSAQYALAVGDYNIRISQPQAPGFYWYVLLGRLVNYFVGEPHAALVWLSVIAGSWLATVGYLLATSMFGRKCGMGTGLILLTSPLCWFHSEIAMTNIVDGALVVSFVFVCWRAIQREVTWFQAILLAVLLAVLAGVRQQTAPLLIPLWLYVFWGFARPRTGKLLCATVLAAGVSLLWFVPTVKSAGGLGPYFDLLHLKSRFDAPRTVWGGGGLGAFLTDISLMGRACWVGLLAAGIVSVWEFVHWVIFEDPTIRGDSYGANRTQLCVLSLWVAPMLLFGVFMYMALPGHILSFFPAITILASVGLVRFSERLAKSSANRKPWAWSGVLFVVVATNAAVFVRSPLLVRHLLLGLDLTGVEIRDHDAKLSACFQVIRQNWPPKNVFICHRREDFYWGFRQFEYHLPEYRNVLLGADGSLPGALGKRKWLGYHRHTTFPNELILPPGQDILIVVPPGESIDKFQTYIDLRTMSLVMDAGIKLYLCHS